MSVTITEEPALSPARYQEVPISFRVERVMRVDGLRLEEEECAEPYVKEYDEPGNQPVDWPAKFDFSPWGLFAARDDGTLVGGAVVVRDTPNFHMLEGRDDLAVLLDLRVRPSHRRTGVGRALFEAAADWSRAKGAVQLKIETQQINARACRFYAARGCRLSAVDPKAYPDLPSETQLIWLLDL